MTSVVVVAKTRGMWRKEDKGEDNEVHITLNTRSFIRFLTQKRHDLSLQLDRWCCGKDMKGIKTHRPNVKTKYYFCLFIRAGSCLSKGKRDSNEKVALSSTGKNTAVAYLEPCVPTAPLWSERVYVAYFIPKRTFIVGPLWIHAKEHQQRERERQCHLMFMSQLQEK